MIDPHANGEKILILDFGSQYTQVIARRVRECHVYSEIIPFTTGASEIAKLKPAGIILSGGPASVYAPKAPQVDAKIYDMGIPVLGICYGMQLIAHGLGGKVERSDHREYGPGKLKGDRDCELFHKLPATLDVWNSHGDKITKLPRGFRALGETENSPHAVIGDTKRKIFGLQFHPEVVHTPRGKDILANFVHRICGCRSSWTMESFIDRTCREIREQVGDGQVILGLSGGVDSSVAAVLIHEAIGDQLTCIYVDHGLMRHGESEEVVKTFRDRFNIKLVHRDASELFLGQLSGVTDPEQKRKIIGRLFIEVFEEEQARLGGADFLAQGTLYPDVIESVSFTGGPSVTIKSHHNVGGLPERMRMQLVEPLRELFKDEVRALGRELKIPEILVGRHPFPGPGLAIRIPGTITREKVALLQRVDAIYLEEIRNAGLYDAIWQAFAVLLPVRTVGVMGDGRTYDMACALRAVTSTDGMTADVYPFDMAFLTRVAGRIVNEVRGINRVTYDITSKPPGTIEWE